MTHVSRASQYGGSYRVSEAVNVFFGVLFLGNPKYCSDTLEYVRVGETAVKDTAVQYCSLLDLQNI